MSKWLYIAVFTVIFPAVMCLLYRGGLLTAKNIRAVIFVFRRGRSFDRVSIDSCTGWVCHALKFRESGRHEFTLESRLSVGSVAVRLLDSQKRPLLALTPQSPAGSAELKAVTRYCLRWEFTGAGGRCELSWK